MRRSALVIVTVVAVVVAAVAVFLLLRKSGETDRPAALPSAAAPSTAAPQPSATGAPTAAPSRSVPPMSPGTPGLPASLRGKDIEVLPTTRPVVALTFDAGANADGLPAILATLAAEGVPGTFFLTGTFANAYPDRVRAIVAANHRLGNHSMTHPSMTGLSDAQVHDEVYRAATAIRASGGTDPRPFFRFPSGDRNARTIALLNDSGYVCVRWTVDTLGWQGTTGGSTRATVLARVLASARAGEIVLMHVGSHPTDHSTNDADALPDIIAQLRARGYGFVTLDVLLG